ncbi:hypothetical protein BH24ACT4_BH24ACT4_03030 [soil metagenome]
MEAQPADVRSRTAPRASADSSIPVAVTGLADAATVSAGGYHTCAMLTDRTARCWGRNFDGQLGIGNTADSNVPVTVIDP